MDCERGIIWNAALCRLCRYRHKRHCFVSHLMEDGTELYMIKRWLGHTSIKTTYTYLHLSPDYLDKVTSPLDYLYNSGGPV